MRFSKVFLALVLVSPASGKSDELSRAGHGIFAVSYQYIRVDGIAISTGDLDFGTTDTHSLNFDLLYHLTDRWSLELGIPVVKKRYRGTFPHDPRTIIPAKNEAFIDDGKYHTNFQDWRIGLSYLIPLGTFTIEPFAAYGIPSNDYPFFAQAAVGQNLRKFDLGVSFSYFPGLSDAFYSIEVSRVFVERTLGVSVDHWRVNAEAGYFFSPRLSARVFGMLKEGDGLGVPEDFPPPRNSEWWYQHDRMVRHNYINVGAGADYALSDRYLLDFSWLTMVHAEQVHIVDYAFTVGVSMAF
ncbi:MAG TPA: hypothetical protein VFG52_07325 [Xanthomonadales bacterium]|nr:hypothetical protein [Xanthomonadales bacterium]